MSWNTHYVGDFSDGLHCPPMQKFEMQSKRLLFYFFADQSWPARAAARGSLLEKAGYDAAYQGTSVMQPV